MGRGRKDLDYVPSFWETYTDQEVYYLQSALAPR